MRRRRFLELCSHGAAATLVGCVPEVSEAPTRRDPGVSEADQDPSDAGARAMRDATTRPDGGSRGDVTLVDAAAPDTGSHADAGAACDDLVVMYDTYAQSLYFDGSLGPTTGVIRVEWVIVGAAVELEFWHGHGGVSHRFTVTPSQFEALKRGERVTIETTPVESHTHQLFIDPTDPRYRVPGAMPVDVPRC